MRLELTGRHLDITPTMRRLVDAKLARLDRMLNDSALSVQVVLSREKSDYRADVTVHARGEKFLHGIGVADGLQGCLSGAFDKIFQQAQKLKGKWQERKRHGMIKGEPAPAEESIPAKVRRRSTRNAAPPQPSVPPAARTRMPRIFRSSRQPLKAMSLAEAARQIDGGDGVVVFRDAETSTLSVLYRAASGELTLVETES